jgi:hypothetical protein
MALTILFIGIIYFMKEEVEVATIPEKVDSIKIKNSAPKRIIERRPVSEIITHETIIPETDSEEISEERTTEVAASEEPADLEHVEQFNDLEEGWNNELKEMLMRLEPLDGEEIHKNYVSEQASYQAEMESLLSEKQQKTSPEATIEMDELINQLDEKHQSRLKDILGAHYEAVKDGLESFMREAHPE